MGPLPSHSERVRCLTRYFLICRRRQVEIVPSGIAAVQFSSEAHWSKEVVISSRLVMGAIR